MATGDLTTQGLEASAATKIPMIELPDIGAEAAPKIPASGAMINRKSASKGSAVRATLTAADSDADGRSTTGAKTVKPFMFCRFWADFSVALASASIRFALFADDDSYIGLSSTVWNVQAHATRTSDGTRYVGLAECVVDCTVASKVKPVVESISSGNVSVYGDEF